MLLAVIMKSGLRSERHEGPEDGRLAALLEFRGRPLLGLRQPVGRDLRHAVAFGRPGCGS